MYLINGYRMGRHDHRWQVALFRLIAACLGMLLLSMSPWSRAADDSFGVHGMVLFGGKDGLYASHLPMFHIPHDAQVVLRVRIVDPDLDRQVRSRLDGGTALWTLDPERFALRRLAPGASQPLEGFSADIVEGHFEQGGTVRHRSARLAVEGVVLFRPLDPSLSVASASHYLPVGPFMVKLIDSRPDFDHIVLLKEPARGAVSVAKTGMEANLRALEASVPVAGTIYYCADDLR
ncbi:hypothetical protein [Massilia sp. METH4]|uniref:hypothetical protein n=1 Tax=Massilia sp. METH4 TaxID=3123041 RepID=UPI0030D21017